MKRKEKELKHKQKEGNKVKVRKLNQKPASLNQVVQVGDRGRSGKAGKGKMNLKI